MRIVILSDNFPPDNLGGAEIIASNLAHVLSEKGHEVLVITTTRDLKGVGVFRDKKLIVHRLYASYDLRFRPYISLYNRRVVKEVEEIIKKIEPDVVHAHNVHTYLSYASLKVSKKYSKAVLLTFHDFYSINYGKLGTKVDSSGNIVPDSTNPFSLLQRYRFRYNPFRNIIIKHYLKYVDRILSVSGAVKKVLESRGISGIEVLHNGINVFDWGIRENILLEFKKKYNLENKKVLFFGGRLTGTKGSSVVIDVLAKVSKKIPNTVLLISGTKSKSSEEMIKKAENLGLKDSIIFTGWINHDEIRYAYTSSDVVLVLSQYIDPFPTVNLEAMASRRPVVGTIFGGTPEAVLDGKTGYIVNPRDIDSVSAKIIDLLTNIEKAKKFGLTAYDRVSCDFSADNWADKTLSWYAKILKDKK